jgi:hypothetical protein
MLLIVIGVIACPGCRPASSDSSATSTIKNSGDESLLGLSPESTPEQVAEMALKAMADKDMETLIKLIAGEKVHSDMSQISRGKDSMQGLVEQSTRLAAGSIRMNMNFLDDQPRRIGETVIDGNRATVVIHGQAAEKALQKELYFVREHDVWKLVPSHR